jgi:uncharacterized protein YybS (DUF2232 family)
MKDSFNMVQEVYEKQGVDASKLDQVKLMMSIINEKLIVGIIPAVIILGGVIDGVLTYYISKAILKRLKYKLNDLTSFDRIRIDNRIVAVLIILTCIGIILETKNIYIGTMIGFSGLLLGMTVLLVQGLSVILYYLKNRLRASKILIGILFIFLIFSFMGIYVVILGAIDMIVNFRKIKGKAEKDEK